MTYPHCFESQEQFDNWVAIDNSLAGYGVKGRFCHDCTKPYAERMRAAGRCEQPLFFFDPVTGQPMQLAENISRGRKPGQTGYAGVTFHKSNQKFHAQLVQDGKTRNLGYFDDAKKAHEVWKRAKFEGSLESRCGAEKKPDAAFDGQPESAWILRRKRRAKPKTGKDCLEKGPVRIRRHFVFEGKRDCSSPDYYAFEYVRTD